MSATHKPTMKQRGMRVRAVARQAEWAASVTTLDQADPIWGAIRAAVKPGRGYLGGRLRTRQRPIPVIWCVRHDQIDQAHFDTRQVSHVVWKDSEDLRRRLANRIRARW